jgi:acyl-CoA dehydrogenase
VQIHQAFLDRCITLLEHKLTTETSMIKYSAKICAARWWMNVCNYSEVMDICWIINFKVYVDNRIARIYAGTNEIMKIVIAADCLKIY